jgi:hypothetical protein
MELLTFCADCARKCVVQASIVHFAEAVSAALKDEVLYMACSLMCSGAIIHLWPPRRHLANLTRFLRVN